MGSELQSQNPVHIFFLPLMTSSHFLPILDIAKLFAGRGVRCTIVTPTPYEAMARSAIKDTPDVDLRMIPLPASMNLKAGQLTFLGYLPLLQPSVEAILRGLRPAAVVADSFFPWAGTICTELGLPWMVFTGTSMFATCIKGTVYKQNVHEVSTLGSDDGGGDEAFVVIDGLPDRIQLLKTQMASPGSFAPEVTALLMEAQVAEEMCYGEIINSFYELESDYIRHYREVLGKKAWVIGPVSLCNNKTEDLSIRGAADLVSPVGRRCQEWLESKPARSVLYICFGSLVPISTAQLQEISVALMSVKCPFLWVVRDDTSDGTSLPWLSEAIADKEAAGECLIVHEWAPQMLILNHPSTGGFVTHCGWNSTLESISAGVPMATWPLFAEQFYNEIHIVDMLKVGVAVGNKQYSFDDDKRHVIPATAVTAAIEQLMGSGDEAEARRHRAEDFAAAARTAVVEGGSSFSDIDNFFEELAKKK